MIWGDSKVEVKLVKWEEVCGLMAIPYKRARSLGSIMSPSGDSEVGTIIIIIHI